MSGTPYTEPMIPERPGSARMIPATLRVPYRPHNSRTDPAYLKTWGSTTPAKLERRHLAAVRHFWIVIGRRSEEILYRMRRNMVNAGHLTQEILGQ